MALRITQRGRGEILEETVAYEIRDLHDLVRRRSKYIFAEIYFIP